MLEGALPVGLCNDSLVLILGTVAHQLAIIHTHCGQPAVNGYKSKAGDEDITKFCPTCWPTAATCWSGPKHRLKANRLTLKEWWHVRNTPNTKFVGTVKIEEIKQ